MASETTDLHVADPKAQRRQEAGRRSYLRWRSLRGLGGLRILGSIVGGAGLYFGSAPHDLWWLPILGFAVIGACLYGRRIRPALGLSFLAGAAFYLPLLTWAGTYVGDVPWLGLALMEALLVIPAGALIAVTSRRLPFWPVWGATAWMAGEFLRGHFPFGGFPWGAIAFTQVDGPLLPAASLIGSAGMGFLVPLAGFSVAELGRRLIVHRIWQRWNELQPKTLLAPVSSVILAFGVGVLGLVTVHNPVADPHERIAIIQGNVPRAGLDFNSQRRAVLDNHALQTHQLADAVRAGTSPKPTLVIWPENSSDIDPFVNPDASKVISDAAADIGVPILVGAVVGSTEPRRNYNMGIVWDPVTGPGQTYTKRHPVPFGEYMPYRSFFRIFSDKVDLLQNEFLPGETVGNLMMAGVNVGDVICFEVVYDSLVRDVVNGGAQVLVVQTNNATFGYTDETWQQMAMSRVRAVEHGRAALVVSTSGISAVIAPNGTVEASIGLFTPGYLTPSVPLSTDTTPGTVIGGEVEWLLMLASPLALIGAWVVRRNTRAHRATATD
ncbi:apolipoprotein N-acyltransferase [Nakamurella antarctica]|uniref:apolipoprotein N-acyltransferase n=1 Tax=Nakamurella antarctica TaxID=1902245 RepID=UPI0013DE54F2|nr:apolipoprotein N-acyltransferase [Nakamurella antarctica]